jgi:hypothetical protein
LNSIYHFVKFRMSVTPIYKGTCITYDEVDVRYSYLSRGKIQFLSNCIGVEYETCSSGYLWHVTPSIIFDENGKCMERMIAILDDGELCCFQTRRDMKMTTVNIDGSYEVDANTSLMVMSGSVLFVDNVVKQYQMVNERKSGFIVNGKARAIEIKYGE